ncbi:MAG: hypothetical protein ACREYC_23725 [Gammaproteobacteria bacterium]
MCTATRRPHLNRPDHCRLHPIVLPAGHYFFRPEVGVTGGDFLYLSAPKPIVPLGTPLAGDLQAWILAEYLPATVHEPDTS